MPAALASPNSSLSDLQILTAATLDKPFSPPQHFYVRQPHCLQIIQLEEADALPPPPAHKAISSSSFASSSYYSSSYDSESEAYSDEEEVEDDEEMCSSYCSSDEDAHKDSEDNVPGSIQSPETYALRMKRILAWREHFDAASALLVPETPSNPLKRKLDSMDEDDSDDSVADNASHSSKRSRSSQYSASGSVGFDLKFLGISSPSSFSSSLPPSTTTTTTSSPSTTTPSASASLASTPAGRPLGIRIHSCTACDSSFDTRENLRDHGLQARAQDIEACAVAVEYAFE